MGNRKVYGKIPKMITVTSRTDFLTELAKLLPPKSNGIELGVLHGDFSRMILDIVKPDWLVLVDPYIEGEQRYGADPNAWRTAYSTEAQYKAVQKRFNNEIFLGKLFIDRGFSYEAVNHYVNRSFSFVYIDACHLYEDVKKDLNDWLPKLKDENSFMTGHDYINSNGFGVVRAVDEFCEEHNFEMVIFNEIEGDFALARKA